jgi:D-beta-D-heptose 7-phosphate kinase/D-beta-D-heptose 1-phosphate adenosyltransferase
MAIVDPKGRDYTKYAGATIITPNRSELAEVTGCARDDANLLLAAGNRLRASLGVGAFAVTLGELGIGLVEENSIRCFATVAKKVFDVCGAGDTVLATLTAALVAGLERANAVEVANLAAGIVIGKVGTAVSSREELLARLADQSRIEAAEKIHSWETLTNLVAQWRINGESVVFTNGCFDLLHNGHLSLLQTAKRHGDRLIVAVNTDCSVRGLKGPNRPIHGQDERLRLLAAMSCVDAVVLFDEETPLRLIKLLGPDVLVKGSDYKEEEVVGAAEVRSRGGKVVLVPLVAGASTTTLLKKATAVETN